MKTLTFATNPEGVEGRKPIALSQQGFTLVELLVVFAILGLLTALVPVAYSKARDSTQYRTAIRTILGDLRSARQSALAQGTVTVFVVDLSQRKYGIAGGTFHELPASVQIRATVGSQQLTAGDVASIEFLPAGGATGGSIEVVRPSGDGTRLRVDWLSGQISQESLLP